MKSTYHNEWLGRASTGKCKDEEKKAGGAWREPHDRDVPPRIEDVLRRGEVETTSGCLRSKESKSRHL